MLVLRKAPFFDKAHTVASCRLWSPEPTGSGVAESGQAAGGPRTPKERWA